MIGGWLLLNPVEGRCPRKGAWPQRGFTPHGTLRPEPCFLFPVFCFLYSEFGILSPVMEIAVVGTQEIREGRQEQNLAG